MILSGAIAGVVTGVFGSGGGMILVPLLSVFCGISEESLFPVSLCVMLPICLCTTVVLVSNTDFVLVSAFPYMIGSILGGIVAGTIGHKIQGKWLHGLFGIFILWGGIRFLMG